MAQAPQIGRLTVDAQISLVKYCNVILDIHQKQQDLRNKMEFIDVAYARYKAEQVGGTDGVDDSPAGQVACGINIDEITVPIVVSQVDSYVSYLNDIYLSGYPIFPVISTPNTILEGEQLQAIIDDHAVRGRYQRQLALSFKDSIKYNFSAIEVDWCALDLYNFTSNYLEPTKDKVEQTQYYINKLKALDSYNTIMDGRVNPVDIPYYGEYAGYIEIISRIELKRRLAYHESSGNGYHTSQAMTSQLSAIASPTTDLFGYFTEKPQISKLINNRALRQGQMMDWVAYLTEEKRKGGVDRLQRMSDMYEYTTLYARIIPEEHKIMNVPKKGTPQVWKLCFVNHEKLVYAKRIFTIYDMLPIFFAQPLEDGFSYQTMTTAENAIPFQDANSKLFSIRLNAARRAVVDRAIYDSVALNPNDVNSPYPAAKIPFKANALLGGKKLDDLYKSIPFDAKGTETVIQDMRMMSDMADDMNGVNKPQRGQFQKGNKSRKEWDDTMAGSYGRMRNTALMLEYQQILPIKEQLKLNIYQYGVAGSYQNMNTGDVYEITAKKLEDMRKIVNNFKLADGLLPADKIASTEILTGGIQLLSSSQILQQTMGPMLPKMFLYLLSVGGVRGLEQFMPQVQAQRANQPGTTTPASETTQPATT